MGRSPGNKGHKGTRAKNGNDNYYKGRYYISFYEEDDDGDERFYAGFNNVIEICKYLKQEINTVNINKIHQALYKALYEKENSYTRLIDGVRLKVYLIDMIDEIKENERREKEMKKFVKINSTIDFEVYPDLSTIDATNPNAPMADRLSVKPNWVHPVLILKGIHFYPSEIKNWKTIQIYNKKQILSISEEVDDIPEDERVRCEKLLKEMKKILARTTGKEKKSTSSRKVEDQQSID